MTCHPALMLGVTNHPCFAQTQARVILPLAPRFWAAPGTEFEAGDPLPGWIRGRRVNDNVNIG